MVHEGDESKLRPVLMEIYEKLYDFFGPQHWWPGGTAFEVMTGAILTQNTSWANVTKALESMRKENLLDVEAIRKIRSSRLASSIRSSGYYRVKARRLKDFVNFLCREYRGDIGAMRKEPEDSLRRKLLAVRGIGPETADSILLYALNKPIFVVDAYTRRILSRHGIVSESATYSEIQNLFVENLPRDVKLFNEYHALLVRLGKTLCKRDPKCAICPLKDFGTRSESVLRPKTTSG